MAVKISTGKPVYSLTSPPEQPTPYPSEQLIAQTIDYGDRQILVTVPFPDTIELTADVLNEHLAVPYATGGAKQIAKKIDKDFCELLEEMKKGDTSASLLPKVQLGPRRKAEIQLRYDIDQPLHRAQLTVCRTPDKDPAGFGSWQIKLELSASKAGPAGLVQLTALIEDALHLNFSAVLADFRVSRLDAAVDLIGAYPLDVIAHIDKPGKRMVYVGTSGHPESIYLYEAKQPLKKPPLHLGHKTTGPLRLKLYERRDYTKQLALSPPFGACPVTRAETEIRWKKKSQRPKLAQLAKLKKNPFAVCRVAYAAKLAGNLPRPREWLAFCLAAFGGGVATAQSKWRLGAGLTYGKLYTSCGGDLVDQTCWSAWKAGLDYTGLSAWIAVAALGIDTDKKLTDQQNPS